MVPVAMKHHNSTPTSHPEATPTPSKSFDCWVGPNQEGNTMCVGAVMLTDPALETLNGPFDSEALRSW